MPFLTWLEQNSWRNTGVCVLSVTHQAAMIIRWTEAEAYQKKPLLTLLVLAANAAVVGSFDEDESLRLVLPCRDGEVSGISGGVMFDWGLLPPLALFLFVNRLPGNVVIIVAEASICSFGGGWVGSCPRFKSIFPGADGRPRGGGGGC